MRFGMENIIKLVRLNKYFILSLILPLILIPFKYMFLPYYFSYKQITILLFISPFMEEVLFRKFLQQYLKHKFNNLVYAILCTNFIFVLMHLKNTFNIVILISIFISGIIFSLVYCEKKNIIYPIFIHFWFNLFYLLQIMA